MKCKTELSLRDEVFFALCKSVNTPVSLGMWLRMKYGDHKSIATTTVDPRSYLNASAFAKDYVVCSLYSKYKGLDTAIDLKAVALDSFKSAEISCLETNKRIRKLRYEGFGALLEPILFRARRKISSLLGPFSLFKISDGYGWGPGATYEFTRKRARLDLKIGQAPFSVTRSALHLAKSVIENDLHWSSVILSINPEDIMGPFCLSPSIFKIVEGCKLTTVPKNAKTDRVIAIEPRLNGFLQKGVGRYIRSRLQTVGVDLDNQEINQRYALKAYTEGLATLDLKAASDSVSTELVYELLPVDWAMFLDDIRSKKYTLNKEEWFSLEKISSMGNGFTFELESLIFWALCESVCHSFSPAAMPPKIYGDDIIVPSDVFDVVVNVLNTLGFTINETKSFKYGNFFESCGKHYFQGIDVTPVYQKEALDTLPEVIRLHNRLVRCGIRFSCFGSEEGPYGIFSSSIALIRRLHLKEYMKYRIPEGAEGDDAFLAPVSTFTFDRNHGYKCKVLRLRPERRRAFQPALLAHWLRSCKDRRAPPEPDQELSFSGKVGVTPLRLCYVSTTRWVNNFKSFTHSGVIPQ